MRIWLVRLAALAALAAAPYVLSSFQISLLTEILIFGLLAASLDLLIGYTGMPSLGHATYFGVGAYGAALVAEHLTGNPLAALGLAVGAAAVVALVTGWLAVRTRGVYFLMLTLAFAQLLFSLAITWEPVTGGFDGLSVLPAEFAGLELDDVVLYWYVVVVAALGYAALRLLITSPFGHALVGVHENEARMRSLGYSALGYRLASFTVAGAFGGLAGALFLQFNRFVSPTTVAFEISALVLIMVIVGGVGTLYGPVLGAGLVLLLREELAARFEHWELFLGAVFVVFVYAMRGGLGGLLRRAAQRVTPVPAGGTVGGKTRDARAGTTRAASAGTAQDPAQDGSVLLELSGLRKEYGSLVAVDDVSMAVTAGERRALIGPNGAGKTTLFNLIGGTAEPTGGTIRFRGRDITRMPEHRRARIGIAKTFQRSNLFDGLSALENVAIAVRRHQGIAHRPLRPAGRYRAVDECAMDLLERVGLADRYAGPAGILSHGERRQLEVAVALAIEPTLILLDEPVAGMSAAERDAFVAMVGALPRTLTILVIEHDMDVVFALANRISVLDAGRVLAEGAPAEVRDDPVVQEAYLGAEQTEIFR